MGRKKKQTRSRHQKPKPVVLSPDARRAIEKHQAYLGSVRPNTLFSVPIEDENWDGKASAEVLEVNPVDDDDPTDPSYLWVYEPADFEELSIEDVKQVWRQRHDLCGSRFCMIKSWLLCRSSSLNRKPPWQDVTNSPISAGRS